MTKRFNREKLREFVFRRRINFMALLAITLLSIAVTVVCAATGFMPERLFILELVSALLVVLCCLQVYRMRKSFRTIKSFKGKRKKKARVENE